MERSATTYHATMDRGTTSETLFLVVPMRRRQNYRSGRAFEWAYRKYLIAQGYSVLRAAGSKGPFDLVFWTSAPMHGVHGVQLKRRGSCAAMDRLRRTLPWFGACPGHVVHEGKDGGFCEH